MKLIFVCVCVNMLLCRPYKMCDSYYNNKRTILRPTMAVAETSARQSRRRYNHKEGRGSRDTQTLENIIAKV